MFSLYVLLLLQILSFTFNPHLKKRASKNITSNEFIIIYQILAMIFSILYIYYLINYKNCKLNCFNKLEKSDYIFTFLSVLTGFTGSILLLYLVKKEELSYIIPNIQGIVIILNTLIAYFIFQESLPINKIIGVILIYLGIIFLNYNKIKFK
jgi:uncharacterized membrane protein